VRLGRWDGERLILRGLVPFGAGLFLSEAGFWTAKGTDTPSMVEKENK